MNCPHCGAIGISQWFGNGTSVVVFDCGNESVNQHIKQETLRCARRQISQLKAELAQSVRRDDPRLRDVEDRIRQAIQMADNDIKGLEDEELKEHATVIHMQAAAFLAFEQLQSIIEGK